MPRPPPRRGPGGAPSWGTRAAAGSDAPRPTRSSGSSKTSSRAIPQAQLAGHRRDATSRACRTTEGVGGCRCGGRRRQDPPFVWRSQGRSSMSRVHTLRASCSSRPPRQGAGGRLQDVVDPLPRRAGEERSGLVTQWKGRRRRSWPACQRAARCCRAQRQDRLHRGLVPQTGHPDDAVPGRDRTRRVRRLAVVEAPAAARLGAGHHRVLGYPPRGRSCPSESTRCGATVGRPTSTSAPTASPACEAHPCRCRLGAGVFSTTSVWSCLSCPSRLCTNVFGYPVGPPAPCRGWRRRSPSATEIIINTPRVPASSSRGRSLLVAGRVESSKSPRKVAGT